MFGEGEEDEGEEEESESSAGAVESFWRCKAVYQREDGVVVMCYSGFFMLMEDYYHPPCVSHTLSCSFHSVFYICFSVVGFYQSFSLE